jgi:hypothetical protein
VADKTWKRRERQVARDFGARRTPLSGGNSAHTRADTLHDELYIEVKARAQHAACRLYDQTRVLARAEGKTPVVALAENNRSGYLLVLAPEDLAAVAAAYGRRE